MKLVLTPIEVRVLGCLVEKEATTPAGYPLSLNALRTACNQKTSRDPVMDLNESTVQDTVDSLIRKTLVSGRSSSGSRVPKYAHRLHDRLNPEFDFSRPELAVMSMLFLRGPQTRGELRTRCARIYDFADTGEVDQVLKKLRARDDGPYIAELPLAPGHKEVRFAHLASGDVSIDERPPTDTPAAPLSDDAARLAALELEVGRLRSELDQTRDELATFRKQFE